MKIMIELNNPIRIVGEFLNFLKFRMIYKKYCTGNGYSIFSFLLFIIFDIGSLKYFLTINKRRKKLIICQKKVESIDIIGTIFYLLSLN